MDKRILSDVVEGDIENVLAQNAHALSNINISSNSTTPSRKLKYKLKYVQESFPYIIK